MEDDAAQNVDSMEGEESKSIAIPLETEEALFSNLSSIRLFYYNSVWCKFNTLNMTEFHCSYLMISKRKKWRQTHK